MVDNPDQWVEPMAKAGATQFTFHYEAVDGDSNVSRLLDKIRTHNLKAGISIKPKTSVSILNNVIKYVSVYGKSQNYYTIICHVMGSHR